MKLFYFSTKTMLVLIICLLFTTELLAQSPGLDKGEVIVLTGNDLTLDEVVRIAENRANISISPEAVARIKAARKVIQHYVDNKIPAYGVNTMYGQDVDVIIPQSEIIRANRINLFQEATIMGDGSQPFLDPGVVRATWALLVNSYSKGFSGVSTGLADELVDRVNSNRIPKDIEDGGSMGGADLIINSKLGVALYDKPGFEVGAGECTNLMTYNYVTIARAALVANRFENLLAKSKVSLALGMEGLRANLTPISKSAAKAATLESKREVLKQMQFLMEGSLLWTVDGPRTLQDFLSIRTSADQLAAVGSVSDHLIETLTSYFNALQVSPMVDVEENRILSVTEWDMSQLLLDMDHFRQALGLMAMGINDRTLKVISRPHTDLPSGFASEDATKFDGLYTRNITYWATSLTREAVQFSQPVTGMVTSYVAEGHEDYYTPFPNSVYFAELLIDRLEKIVAIEALIGSFAIERRLQSGELTENDVPPLLRTVQKEIIQRSPMQIDVDEQYSFAPLLQYFIEEYQPPQE